MRYDARINIERGLLNHFDQKTKWFHLIRMKVTLNGAKINTKFKVKTNIINKSDESSDYYYYLCFAVR